MVKLLSIKEGHQIILRLGINPALDDAREILTREKASQQSRPAGNAIWKRVLYGMLYGRWEVWGKCTEYERKLLTEPMRKSSEDLPFLYSSVVQAL